MPNKSGSRLVVWPNGLLAYIRSTNSPEVSSLKEAETRAIPVALIKVKRLGFSRVHVFSNAVEVVRAIDGMDDWSLRPNWLILSSMLAGLILVFSHISRTRRLNVYAHEPAKQSYI